MKTTHRHSTQKARRRLLRYLQLCLPPGLLLAVVAGCARDGTANSGTNPVGTYALVSVDGKNVPCEVNHGGHALTVKSGIFLIKPDGTCSSKVEFAVPSGQKASKEVEAKYTQKGDKLFMQWKGAGSTTGTVSGDNFTMNNEGMLFAYRK